MKKPRIASLDGIRALAIVLVLLAHSGNTRDFPAWNIGRSAGDLGHLGVTIFFVISGYLITTLLINEFDTTGKVSLKDFYKRRALRILPAAYVYLSFMATATYFQWIELTGNDFLFGATFLVNYDAHRSWYAGHLWSLAVEEQFYLLWPVLFVRLNRKHALIVALLAFLSAPVVRALMRIAIPPGPYRDMEIFPAVADGMAIGCAFAIMRPRLLNEYWYLKLTASRWMWLLPALIIAVNRFDGFTLIDLFGSLLQLVAIAMLIESGTRHASSLVGEMLISTPAIFIGTLSYSIYLWQQPFMDRHLDSWLATFPWNLILALAAAACSYYLVERPFLRLRRGFGKVSPAPHEIAQPSHSTCNES